MTQMAHDLNGMEFHVGIKIFIHPNYDYLWMVKSDTCEKKKG